MTRAWARAAGGLVFALACAALLSAWLVPDIVAAWASLASLCG